MTTPIPPAGGPHPGAGDLSPAVTEILIAAGWHPGRHDEQRSRAWALLVAGYPGPAGQMHPVVSPARDVFARFGGLCLVPTGDGEQVAPSTIRFDPTRVLQTTTTLAAFAAALGSPLTPIGDENDGVGILVTDANGRVFVLDHTAEWYLGASIEEAITTLLLGRQPQRIREDGTW